MSVIFFTTLACSAFFQKTSYLLHFNWCILYYKLCGIFLEFLTQFGNNLNFSYIFSPKDGVTTLHVAAHYGQVKTTQSLLEKGANIDQKAHVSFLNPFIHRLLIILWPDACGCDLQLLCNSPFNLLRLGHGGCFCLIFVTLYSKRM